MWSKQHNNTKKQRSLINWVCRQRLLTTRSCSTFITSHICIKNDPQNQTRSKSSEILIANECPLHTFSRTITTLSIRIQSHSHNCLKNYNQVLFVKLPLGVVPNRMYILDRIACTGRTNIKLMQAIRPKDIMNERF